MDLKEQYKQAFETVTPDPAAWMRIEREVLEQMNKHNHTRIVRRTVLSVAIVAALLFGTVAVASGWAQSIFGGLAGRYGTDNKDFATMEENAQTEVAKVSITFKGDARPFDFEVSEAYSLHIVQSEIFSRLLTIHLEGIAGKTLLLANE